MSSPMGLGQISRSVIGARESMPQESGGPDAPVLAEPPATSPAGTATVRATSAATRGSFALVLHSHLPWLAHHGAWPVGEEWLYQAWGSSYLPLLDVLDDLAAEGRRNLLTLGITPVLAAQLDDPHSVRGFHTWLGFWQARSEELAGDRDPDLRALAGYEFSQASAAHEAHQQRGPLTSSFRRLADAGAVELLGGPASHAFQPLLDDDLVAVGLQVGLADSVIRFGDRPRGIWAPECGYRPGLEEAYQAAGIGHFMMDGPTFLHVGAQPWAGRRVGDSDVIAFARDLEVSYRVWSPKRGYPSDPHYRDFHAMHHDSGFRPARVTSFHTKAHEKAPYDPASVPAVIERDARDFVDRVVARLAAVEAARGEPGLVVAAFDTELFGHWWHEGPRWLARVLRLLPEAGVELCTLAGAVDAGLVDGACDFQPGSWGSGKDWRVWAGTAVADIVADNERLTRRWRGYLGRPSQARTPALDQLAREALLALSSDWAFMISKDSAAGYARARHDLHHRRFQALADLIDAGAATNSGAPGAQQLAARLRRSDGPFGHVDARVLGVASEQLGVPGRALTTRR